MGSGQVIVASGTVVRARVRAAGDIGTARLRAAAVIGGADLRAPSLPPSAVLCVRRVHVSAPIGVPHTVAARRDFDRVMQARLDELARRAERPAVDVVGSCDAVVFDDVAELMACLARDVRAGRAGDRWWWRTLFRERMALELVVNTWSDAPSLIAPAFERLAEWREAAGFASMLDRSHVQKLASAMLQAHGGPPAPDLIARRSAEAAALPLADRTTTPEIYRIAEAVVTLVRRYAAADTAPPLRRDQRALLAVAAVVRHYTPFLRRTGFTEAFHTALRTLESTRDMSWSFAVQETASVADLEQGVQRQRQDEPGAGQAVVFDRPPERLRTGGITPARDARPDPVTAFRLVDEPRSIADEAPGMPQVVAGPPTRPHTEPAPIPRCVDTPMGGVFYLLNAAIALRLYGDFTMPARRGLPISPWDLLALAAEQWSGEPLDLATAGLLAQLAGRSPDERPGERAEPADRLARWMPRLVRRINRWVAGALGEPAEVNLARRVLYHQARVHVTAAHVDVMFDLASLPIELRLAGLDRDPGWIPAAGRVVRFHYT